MPDPHDHSSGEEPLESLLARASREDPEALEALLQRARDGDDAALTGLVQLGLEKGQPAARDRLWVFAAECSTRLAGKQRRNRTDDPDSMAHDGIAKLIRRPPRLKEYTGGRFRAYLRSMMRNAARERERKRRKRRETTLGGESKGHRKPPVESPDPIPPRNSQESTEFVLSRCRDEDDRIMLRGLADELKYAEIGQLLTPPRSAAAVRMRITRLLVELGHDPGIQREHGHDGD
jgi:DNA-directed RNA polymerase specialized sigma24 family protein